MSFVTNVAKIYDLVVPEEPAEERIGTLRLKDPEYDFTVLDFSDNENITVNQTDEFGKVHTLILSARMVEQLLPHMIRWNSTSL